MQKLLYSDVRLMSLAVQYPQMFLNFQRDPGKFVF